MPGSAASRGCSRPSSCATRTPCGGWSKAHLDGDAPVEAALADFGRALAGLLLGESAVAINRAAISEARTAPELGRILSQSGREATLPVFVRYLERHRSDGALAFDDAVQAAEAYIGLLLGGRPGQAPARRHAAARQRRARRPGKARHPGVPADLRRVRAEPDAVPHGPRRRR